MQSIRAVLRTGMLAVLALLGAVGLGAAPAATPFIALADGRGGISISHQGADFLRLGLAAWGPNWAWTGINGSTKAENRTAAGTFTCTIGQARLTLQLAARQTQPNTLQITYALSADRDTALTLFIAEVAPAAAFKGGQLVAETAGKSRTLNLPLPLGPVGDAVSALRFRTPAGAEALLRLEPPIEVAADGAARIVLAKERLAAGNARELNLTLTLPGPVTWYASAEEIPDTDNMAAWYPWRGTGMATNSVLDMSAWLDKPAGRHGRIVRREHQLLYQGQPIKLWGLNLCYNACAPDKALAEKRAALYPRYGINSVRLHKFADGTGWAGIQAEDSAAEYDPAGLDRMDYQIAKFKEAGIYVKLSAHFGTLKMGPADRRDVPFMDEFGQLQGRGGRLSAPHSAFFYSPELQNLHIRQIVNLLRHTNAYTGLAYAKDPAVWAVEIINEQSIFFYTSMQPLQKSATLRRQVGERFSDWLRKKYGSHAGLLKAWGERALDGFQNDGFPAGEHLDKRNLLPLGNPWYWDPAQLNGSQAFRRQRLLDTLEFLYTLQNEAYDRFVAAVRAAGFDGEILGSNWQAGRAFSHYANLHTDYRVGLIDRHNYFGGGSGRTFGAGSMLARPGSGMLSSGLQQVADRPFMLSEWIHVFPNEWGVEGPALLGAYGMGLQGWDASYMFQNGDQATFSRQLGGSEWDVMAPQILGVFPAVARQVLRGDVQEAPPLAVRHVHLPSLFQGKLGFEDSVAQGYDDKELDSAQVPAGALAVARCVVQFTPQWRDTPVFDLKPHLQNDFLVSTTRQLRWKPGNQPTSGFFLMDTPGTKAVVGFAAGQPARLGEVTLTPQSRFAALYVTAVERNATLANARRVLVVALARARNTGMKFSPAGNELLHKGAAPILMEPVRAELQWSGRPIQRVHVLDHNGVRTGQTLPVQNNRVILNGEAEHTPYYEIEF
ncbi:MAG: beta-galactosidase [Verrucomicrobiae bacterium]|nr:beta-galactosidase [Verrucomicrobiae bacterium]